MYIFVSYGVDYIDDTVTALKATVPFIELIQE